MSSKKHNTAALAVEECRHGGDPQASVAPTLLMVGSLALDTVEAPGGSTADVLGGALTYASLACSFFARPVPICVVGEDFPEEHIALLASYGVDTRAIQRTEGKTFRWKARYLEDYDERETLDTQCNVFADFQPTLNEEQRKAEYAFLANIHPSLQLSVLDQMPNPKLVAADTMDLWINTEPDEVREVISRCNILFLNDSEARLLCGKRELMKIGEELSKMGPRCVVIKRGSHGAFLYQRGDACPPEVCSQGGQVFLLPAYPVKRVVDPTGAGDAFAGAMMGYLAKEGDMEPETVRKAVVLGTIMASFIVEDFSVKRLETLTKDELLHRCRELAEMTSFREVSL
jgi:sugar/nucleoside kinase (ribokinase family)